MEEKQKTVITLSMPPEALADLERLIKSRDPAFAAAMAACLVDKFGPFKLDKDGFWVE